MVSLLVTFQFLTTISLVIRRTFTPSELGRAVGWYPLVSSFREARGVAKDRIMIFLVALAMDALLGDPPNRFHPVAWMGSAIATAKRQAPQGGSHGQLLYGALITLTGCVMSAVSGALLTWLLKQAPRLPRWLAGGAALKLTLSLRGLTDAALMIRDALAANDLAEARSLLGWHLVSRDTRQLSPSQVAAATIESVAENASDGFVAPLLYFALFGLPGALAYRFANTADAMLGYRDATHEWLGKAPARLDDAFNLLPARATALALVASAALTGENARRALHIWQRDRRNTASPNAGHPMSVAAGALGVTLEKIDHYTLGAGLAPPSGDDIGRMIRLLRPAALLAAGLSIMLAWRLDKRR